MPDALIIVKPTANEMRDFARTFDTVVDKRALTSGRCAVNTRNRLLTEGLRLFGELGYSRANVSQIEAAAGLSPGAGGMYRHFRSKEDLLVAAVTECLADWGPYAQFAEPDFSAAAYINESMPDTSLEEQLVALCHVGLLRADHIRDVVRVLLRDNSIPAGILDTFRVQDHEIMAGLVERTLRDLATDSNATTDWRPTAEVVVGAMSYLWLMRDIFGTEDPCGISADDYIRATAELAATRIHAAQLGDRVDTPAGQV